MAQDFTVINVTPGQIVTRMLEFELIAAELSHRNYNGRVYAKAQNVRPTYIKAYDAALANVDVLVMPTCIMTAPKNHTPGSYLEAVEDNLEAMNSGGSRNTLPFNYTGHPALALPVGFYALKSFGGPGRGSKDTLHSTYVNGGN